MSKIFHLAVVIIMTYVAYGHQAPAWAYVVIAGYALATVGYDVIGPGRPEKGVEK